MTTLPPPAQVYSVSANVGLYAAEPTYFGGAPSMVAGTAQVNLRISNCARTGRDQPLILGVLLQPEARSVFSPATAVAITPGPGWIAQPQPGLCP